MSARRVAASATLGLVLLAGSGAFAQSAPAGQPQQEAIAQTRFGKGRELFIAGKYAEALAEFRAAGELFESPNTRLYIGRCERALGHLAAAHVELERAASEAADRAHADPRYASTHDVAKQEASALEAKLGHVTILAPGGLPDGTVITVNGSTLAPAAVGVAAPIDPGSVEVEAKAPGYVALHRTAQVAAGESVEIKIKLDVSPSAAPSETTNATTGTTASTEAPTAGAPAGTEEHPVVDTTPHAGRGLRNAGFVVGGIGIVGLGVFSAFAALAQTRFDQLKTQCNGGPCDASYGSQIDEGQAYQNVANVSLAIGGAALVVGTIMVVAGVSAGSPAASGAGARRATPLRASVMPLWSPQGPSGAMVGVGRDF